MDFLKIAVFKLNSRDRGGAGAFTLLQVLFAICLIGLLCFLIIRQAAAATDQQGLPVIMNSASNIPPTVSTGAISNGFTSYVPIRQGRGLSLQYQFNVSSGTSNVVLQIAPSSDGTNADSSPWYWTLTASGTTTLTRTTNWTRGSLDGYQGFFIVGSTNQNAGTLTNKSLLYVIPNS